MSAEAGVLAAGAGRGLARWAVKAVRRALVLHPRPVAVLRATGIVLAALAASYRFGALAARLWAASAFPRRQLLPLAPSLITEGQQLRIEAVLDEVVPDDLDEIVEDETEEEIQELSDVWSFVADEISGAAGREYTRHAVQYVEEAEEAPIIEEEEEEEEEEVEDLEDIIQEYSPDPDPDDEEYEWEDDTNYAEELEKELARIEEEHAKEVAKSEAEEQAKDDALAQEAEEEYEDEEEESFEYLLVLTNDPDPCAQCKAKAGTIFENLEDFTGVHPNCGCFLHPEPTEGETK